MERYVCLHGHFYQPPRENPWLEAIELQDSAYPYHDWNARITAECYGPNSAARILDAEERIIEIVNNYSKISFNFGPTLLAWLHDQAPDVYAAILEADRQSQERFSGHGSALAQAYNHMIMPLALRRDRVTQVRWGIRDFQTRFGRDPEGMWLPETAVDLDTLDILAEHGIAFTLLAPSQARRVRRLGGRNWRDVSGGRIDPTRPYLQRLPSGREITLFFYDGPISQAVAFERLLVRGEYLAGRLLNAFTDDRTWPQLVHIATDGETYGHHHRQGEMALAYALYHIETQQLARLTNYGEYLALHPPTHQVEIVENTSWSCVHGIERWRRDCGCNSGGYGHWNQAWRGPLRQALDWLRDAVAPLYEQDAERLLHDPWAARDAYIDVVLDRSTEAIDAFLAQHGRVPLGNEEQVRVLKLLELQRHAMLMYTSCGWFFDELSGIETVQVIQYAGRVVQLAEDLFQQPFESPFRQRLEAAKSNLREHRDGSTIYEKFVKPAMVDWEKIGAHYAVSSMFEAYPEHARIYCYTADSEDYQRIEAGRTRLAVGRVRLTSTVTREAADLSFGVIHFGDHNVNGGVRAFIDVASYQHLQQELIDAFERADFPEVIRLLDRYFGESYYSLRSLFRDEQRRILSVILETTLAQVESAYRQIYETEVPMMRFLTELHIPLPRAFQAAAEFVLNNDLRRAFEAEDLDLDRIHTLLQRVAAEGVSLDAMTLEYAFRQSLERLARRLLEAPDDVELLQRLEAAAHLAHELPFDVDLSRLQNICYTLLKQTYPRWQAAWAAGVADAPLWCEHFKALCERIAIRVDG